MARFRFLLEHGGAFVLASVSLTAAATGQVAQSPSGQHRHGGWLPPCDGRLSSPLLLDAEFDPSALVLADLDQDGDLDLAVNHDSHVLWIRRNDGGGVFSPPVEIPSERAFSMTSADLDQDGAVDLVLANWALGSLSVYWNDGAGNFARGNDLPVGLTPGGVTAADLDRDGLPDLVCANFDSDTVSLLINLGSRQFAPQLTLAVADRPNSIACTDLDQDGWLDLAVGCASNVVSVLRNQVTSFSPPVSVPVGQSWLSGITSADLDGDGFPDLAVTTTGGDVWGYFELTLWILHNQNGASFAPPVSYAGGTGTAYPLGLDADGDGDVDLAVVNGNAPTFHDTTLATPDVSLFLNAGGTLTRSSIPLGAGAGSPAAGDLDGDGDLDLAVANAGSDTISLIEGLGGGAFQTPESYPSASYPGHGPLASADFDRDGAIDLALAATDDSSVDVRLNQPGSRFDDSAAYATTTSPRAMTSGDLDGDGAADLAVAGVQAAVLLNLGDGTFAPYAPYPLDYGPWSLALADLDGDGDLDLATTNNGSNDLSVLANQGDGTFAAQVTYPMATGPLSLAAGDVDLDGDRELVASAMGGSVSVFDNPGNGVFPPRVAYPARANGGVVCVDLDGDGAPEIATVSDKVDPVAFSVLANRGDGTFARFVLHKFGGAGAPGPTELVAGDLDHDGDRDLVLVRPTMGAVAVASNDGTGLSFAVTHRAADWGPLAATLADLDGDGDSDVATSGWVYFSVLRNLCR